MHLAGELGHDPGRTRPREPLVGGLADRRPGPAPPAYADRWVRCSRPRLPARSSMRAPRPGPASPHTSGTPARAPATDTRPPPSPAMACASLPPSSSRLSQSGPSDLREGLCYSEARTLLEHPIGPIGSSHAPAVLGADPPRRGRHGPSAHTRVLTGGPPPAPGRWAGPRALAGDARPSRRSRPRGAGGLLLVGEPLANGRLSGPRDTWLLGNLHRNTAEPKETQTFMPVCVDTRPAIGDTPTNINMLGHSSTHTQR